VGALFIPALALAAGTFSGSPKLFEAVYVILWYAGPINRVGPLDFMGTTSGTATGKVALAYLLGAAMLLLLAFLGRRRQVQI
jgi:hypothetical protein